MQRSVDLERLLKSMFFPKETHRFQAAVPAAAAPLIFASSRRRKKTSLAMATILRRIVVEPGHLATPFGQLASAFSDAFQPKPSRTGPS
jgi:hypothetical protein